MTDMILDRSDWLKGIRARELELKKDYLKYIQNENKKQEERYDTMYTIYGLFGDCLESPHLTKLDHVQDYILKVKQYLNKSDLNELRDLYIQLSDLEEVYIGNEVGGKQLPDDCLLTPKEIKAKEKVKCQTNT